MIVYGRNPVREALRGRRSVKRVWASTGAAREAWLEACDRRAGRRSRARAAVRLARPPGDLRRDAAPIPTPTPNRLLAAEDALVVCLDEIQDPRNLGRHLPRGGVRRRRRRGDPGAALGGGHAGRLQGLRGRRRAPAGRPRCATSPTGSARPRRPGAWVYGAAADGRRPTTSPTTRAAWSWSWARRARAAPAGGRRCDELVSLPLRGKSSRSTSSPPPRRWFMEILQSRRPT